MKTLAILTLAVGHIVSDWHNCACNTFKNIWKEYL